MTERPPASTWPLVGRRDELRALERALDGDQPGAVVAVGEPGVGKTRLVTEAVALAATRGFAVERAVASRAAASIPFGALAPLLPVESLAADSAAGVFGRAARALKDSADGGPVALLVDDAHHLDEASATLVYELVSTGPVAVVATAREREPLPKPIAALVSEGLAATLTVRPLSRFDVDQLVTAVLDGPVDGAVLQYVWDASTGNPLYLRELLIGGVNTGVVRWDSGLWRLGEKRRTPPRLAELIESRLADLDAESIRLMELLSLGEPVSVDDLVDMARPDVLDQLEQRGLVTVVRDGKRRPARLAHPLYEDATQARMGTRRLAAVRRQLADLVQRRGARRRGDHLRAAALLLDAGGTVDSALLEAAAREAYLVYDLKLTERVVRAAVDAGAAPRLVWILGETLRWQGRHEEAEDLLAGIDLSAVSDAGEATMIAMTRAECLYRGLARRREAEQVLNDAEAIVTAEEWRSEMRALRAVFASLSGDVEAAIAVALPIAREESPRPAIVAATAASTALMMAGKADDAAAIAEHALGLALSLGPQPGLSDPALHALARCLALAESGRVTEGAMISRTGYEWSLANGLLQGQAWFGLVLGRCLLGAGQLEEAERRFHEASVAFRDVRETGLRRWCLAGVAQAAAQRAKAERAAAALKELDADPPTAMRLAEVEVERARAATAIAEGERSRAQHLLAEAARLARGRGQHGLELAALHDLVRIDEAKDVGARIAELGEVQGLLASARRAHAEALAKRDAAGLVAASERFEATDAVLLAAEASAQASALFAADGARASAADQRRRAEDLGARCGARTPALLALDRATPTELTKRETEVAELAARGTTSRDIAERLGISVRTVDNLLQRTYVKLGISGRKDLAAVLGEPR